MQIYEEKSSNEPIDFPYTNTYEVGREKISILITMNSSGTGEFDV